ncbi:MAG: GNAT family N-acetyltransferase [Paracoccaceae bacterium]
MTPPPIASRPAVPSRMHQHPYYAQTMLALGLRACPAPDGSIAVMRRFAGLPVAWLPAPLSPPNLRNPMAPVTLISATSADMDSALKSSGAIPVMTPQCRAQLDLSASEPARRAALHQKWRNRLKMAETSGAKLHHCPLPDTPDHWLLRAETAQRKQQKYRALPAAFALNWPETRLFTLRKRQTDLAAMLFLIHGAGATYHIGWTSDQGRAMNAHSLILWQAANWLAARGCTELDLGPLDTINTPGLARFKLGTGARPTATGHAWIYTRATAALGRLVT